MMHASLPASAAFADAATSTARSVSVDGVANCPFSLAIDAAETLVALVESSAGVRVGPFRRRVRVRALRRPDRTEPGRMHDELAFVWDARSRWLPNFSGVLRFRIEAPRTRLMLSGTYVPPAAAFGRAFDRVAGHAIARATLHDVVRRLARALERQWDAERDA